MPDLEQAQQCEQLAKALWFLAPPARGPVAAGLYSLGVRIHPELATKTLEREGPSSWGNHAPSRLVSRAASTTDPIALLRSMGQVQPSLLELADKMEAAQTEKDKALLITEIRAQFPDVIKNTEDRIAQSRPEDFE
ncbi:hypothetical protein BKG86_01775 [Mycobacteroides chelonae]|uniref:hypothetical protein n=1 Tax=Mycobacteroides chelonae TaxID=1774 RepID=UPI0008A937F9|nr:hypothetical protein [Mycobacteroides chelonae]OHU68808.1 hypothetical protein BKG86_01775 [Mycobacteroides chelonae]